MFVELCTTFLLKPTETIEFYNEHKEYSRTFYLSLLCEYFVVNKVGEH